MKKALAIVLANALLAVAAFAADPPPTLSGIEFLPAKGWTEAGNVALDKQDAKKLAGEPGRGIMLSAGRGLAGDLFSKEKYGDIELHAEFIISAHSNSGVYFMGSYEVQVYDSFGVAKDEYPGIECGGIYPEWINGANAHGHSPLVNASKRPGEWQTFDVIFRAPRFDAAGKKIANARFVKVVHNGQVVQENVELFGPTRGGLPEKAAGPLRLQGDHGPVAYRNLRIREMEQSPKPPAIVKKGTIGVDLCETTPFVFKDKLYRLEWKRANAHDPSSYLRIVDHDSLPLAASGREISHFGDHHRFPCAFVEGGTVYVIGTSEDHGWCGSTLKLFTSKDLRHWDERVAYQNPEFRMCNTSICKADGRYMMSVELAVGGYMGRFLESKDLLHWTLAAPECRIGGGSPHCLRYANGWYYLFSTVGGHKSRHPGEYGGYVMVLNRSRDLKKWAPSPFNPVLVGTDDDKKILNPKLTAQDRADIAKNAIRNNSDIDFCEYQGRLIINYCWGTQGGPGHEYVAEAEFAGTEPQFLEGWFLSSKSGNK